MNFTRKNKVQIVGQLIITADAHTDSKGLHALTAETGTRRAQDESVAHNVESTPASEFKYEVREDGTIAITEYIGSSDDVVVPAVIDGQKVSHLELPFNSDIRKITILADLTRIDMESSNLEELILPSDLQSIDIYVASSINLQRVSLPDTLHTLKFYAFGHCYELNEIELPMSLVNMEGNPFSNAPTIVQVPENHPVFMTQDGALFNHQSKTLVHYPYNHGPKTYVVPPGTQVIGDGAFEGSEQLEEVILPEGLQVIENGAFVFCHGLRSAILPDTLQRIEKAAFSTCRQLSMINLPDGVELIGERAFYECKNLKQITLPKNLQSLGEQAFGKNQDLNVYLHPGSPAEKAVLNYNQKEIQAGRQALKYIVQKQEKIKNTSKTKEAVVPSLLNRQTKGSSLPKEGASASEKLKQITQELQTRYAGQLPLSHSMTRIANENPDLQVSAIQGWTRAVHDETAAVYLKRVGILVEKRPTVRDQYQKNQASRSVNGSSTKTKAEKVAFRTPEPMKNSQSNPFQLKPEDMIYRPEELNAVQVDVYEVPELQISGEEAEDWELRWLSQDNQYLLEDYKGDSTRIVLPASINGECITGINNYGFQKCRAEEVLIPGCFMEVPRSMFYNNTHLKSITLGEGMKTIAQSAFSGAVNLAEIYVSASVDDLVVDYGLGLKDSKWFQQQGDVVVLGKMLLACKSRHSIVKIPHGVEVICHEVIANQYAVKAIVLPETVTTLREYAFRAHADSNLSQIHIPSSVTTIEKDALGINPWTESLGEDPIIINDILYRWEAPEEHVVIPEGVVSISKKLFVMQGIKSVTFPSTLRRIENWAFSGCGAIKALSFSEGLEHIGTGAFAQCNNLKTVVLPDSLTTLEKNVFYKCRNLSRVRLGKGTKTIGENAFSECIELTHVSLNEGLEYLGQEAFSKCMHLNTVSLPASLRFIGERAFLNCNTLERIQLPQGIGSIPKGLFNFCKKLSAVRLPDSIQCIGDEAFQDCDSLQDINWPMALDEIGKSAFRNCIALEYARLPRKVGVGAFSYCTSLKNLDFSSELRSIPAQTFSSCISLTSLILPETIEQVGREAFQSCTQLRSIVLPAYLKLLGDGAFQKCSSLKDVQLPKTIDHQGEKVFARTPFQEEMHGNFVLDGTVLIEYLGKEQRVTIPDGITEIAEEAFVYFENMRELTIPDSVIKIGKRAFVPAYDLDENRFSLHTLQLGNGVRTIGAEAFSDNNKMQKITFGSALEEIGSCAFECNKSIKEVMLDQTRLMRLGDKAFYNCESLKKLTLPETLLHIGDSAFKGCSQLDPFELPAQLQYIGRDAFRDAAIDVVRLPKTMMRVERSAFAGARELIVYDNIEPDAVEADQWNFDSLNGTINAPFACALISIWSKSADNIGSTDWKGFHITVLSAQTDQVKYRIYCDGSEHHEYLALMFSAGADMPVLSSSNTITFLES